MEVLQRGAPFSPSLLSVLSYNILAPAYVRPVDLRTGEVQAWAAFPWCSDASLLWENRRPQIVRELHEAEADVVMLQASS